MADGTDVQSMDNLISFERFQAARDARFATSPGMSEESGGRAWPTRQWLDGRQIAHRRRMLMFLNRQGLIPPAGPR